MVSDKIFNLFYTALITIFFFDESWWLEQS